VLLDDQPVPQRDHHQRAEDPAEQRDEGDPRHVHVEAHQQQRRQRERDAGKGDVVADAAIWGGAKNSVHVTVGDPLRIMMPIASRREMKVTLRYDGPLRAPVALGQQIGTLTVTVPGKPDKVVPAVAAEAVPSNGFLDKMMMGLQVLVFGADKV
jgi:D-alanyl-D-alanine carboxypeptidase